MIYDISGPFYSAFNDSGSHVALPYRLLVRLKEEPPSTQFLATDSPEAAKYRAAAAAGDFEAAGRLGCLYLMNGHDSGVPQNVDEGMEWVLYAADMGDPFSIGLEWQHGWRRDQNVPKAIQIYEQLAQKGNYFAQYHLGWMYEQGEDIPSDTDKAVELYKEAAAGGNEEGQRALKRLDSLPVTPSSP